MKVLKPWLAVTRGIGVCLCLTNPGSRYYVTRSAAIKWKHLTYIFMVFNNPEVLIKMKADIGMKDPPTVAVFNVQDFPLKGEHFLTSRAFILIAYRKTWGKKKRDDLQRLYNSPAPHVCCVNRWPVRTYLDSWTCHEHTCEHTRGVQNFLEQRNVQNLQTHISNSLATWYSVHVQRSHLIPSYYNDY